MWKKNKSQKFDKKTIKKFGSIKNDFRNFMPQKRLVTTFLIFILLFAFVFGKFAFVMLWQNQELQTKALEQWYRDVPIKAQRGDILDRNGVQLATSTTRYSIFVRPNAVKNMPYVVEILSSVLGLDKIKLTEKLTKKASEITIAKSVEKEKISMLYSYGLQGVYYAEENFRTYPYGDFLSSVLGFCSLDGDGQTGLEAYYNMNLKGVNGKILTASDLIGRELENASKVYVPSIKGMALKTTIDSKIAQIANSAVKKAVEIYHPKNASCLVMNYKTGEILAIAEAPSFDLNSVPRDDIEKLFAMSKSQMVSNVFEPGSTFKILTSAIALETGVVNPESRFYCNGSRMVDGQKIKCWKFQGHGSINFAEGVEKSCNCVFMDLAMRVGTQKFYDYLRKFGLNQKTGIDMKGETSGILLKEEIVKNVDLARIGFGQAIAISPIELVTSTSAVVNGGKKVVPHLMSAIYDEKSNVVIENYAQKSENILSQKTSATMRELLCAVVEKGSGKGAYVPGYKIIGKTGTAQKYANGHIAQGKYVSSFLGFSTTKDADFAVLMIVDEPQGYQYYGSLVAAPLVGEVFANIFSAFQIAPHFSETDFKVIGEKFTLPSFVGLTLQEAKSQIEKLGLHFEVGDGVEIVKSQFPLAGTKVDKRNVVLLL